MRWQVTSKYLFSCSGPACAVSINPATTIYPYVMIFVTLGPLLSDGQVCNAAVPAVTGACAEALACATGAVA